MDNITINKQHPIKILSYATKYFWLLSIPLARGLINLKFDFKTWLEGAWLDLIVVFFILCFGFLRWLNAKYSFTENSVIIYTGIILKQKKTILYSNITAFAYTQNPLNRIINATVIYIDTNSPVGNKKASDISITIPTKYIDSFIESYKNNYSGTTAKISFSPKKTHLALFSILFSNTLSGVILIATLIYQSGKYIGEEFEKNLVTTVTDMTSKTAKTIPPAAIILSLLIIAGWILSFSINLLNYWHFRVERKDNHICIKSGIFIKRFSYINIKKINYADIRQSILTMLFNISSFHIHCTGYGKHKREISVLVPITTKNQVLSTMRLLLPTFTLPDILIKPRRDQIERFIFWPIIFVLLIPIGVLTAILYFPNWIEMIIFIGIVVEIPFVWLLIVKIVSTYTTGIGNDENYFVVSYCKLYGFHKVIIPKEKISKISISQTIFQKQTDDCDVRIYTHAEKQIVHAIKNMPYTKMKNYFFENNYNI